MAGSSRRSTNVADPRSVAAADLQVELAADALYDGDFTTMLDVGAAAAWRRRSRSPSRRSRSSPGASSASPNSDSAGSPRRRLRPVPQAAGLDALSDDADRAPPRRAVLPRLRRVLRRALRGRDPPSASRHRRVARVGAGAVRDADDDRSRALVRGDRPASRGTRPGRGRRRRRPAVGQPPGSVLGADRGGVDRRDRGRAATRPHGGRRGCRAARRPRRERALARDPRPRRRGPAGGRRARALPGGDGRRRRPRVRGRRARPARLAVRDPRARRAGSRPHDAVAEDWVARGERLPRTLGLAYVAGAVALRRSDAGADVDPARAARA